MTAVSYSDGIRDGHLSKLNDFLDSPLSSSPEIPCRSVAWFTEPREPAMVTPLRENDHTNGTGGYTSKVDNGGHGERYLT